MALARFSVLALFLIFISSSISANTIYVDDSAAPGGDGTSWADAYTAIQTAINNSLNYDEIIVAEGFYSENLNLNGKLVTLTGTDPNDLTVVAATVIDGGASGSVITCNNGETADTVIAGFTIQNGKTSGFGGGINCYNTSPIIKNCVFSDNTFTGSGSIGGGFFSYLGQPTISGCTFIGNGDDGEEYDPRKGYGGGIGLYDSDAIVTSCVFSGNKAYRGGGISCYSNTPSEPRCNPTITNCTFSQNTSTQGGAIHCYQDSTPSVVNCIMWGDSATNSGNEIHSSTSSPIVSYSVIKDGWTGAGDNNLSDDPNFIDPDGLNFYLDAFSVCINAGDPAGDYAGQQDISGFNRVLYDRVDVGAYEIFPIGGDLNEDELVDVADLIMFVDTDSWLVDNDLPVFAKFARQWMYGIDPPVDGDLNGDGQVDLADLIMLADSDSWLDPYDLVDFSILAGNWLYGT